MNWDFLKRCLEDEELRRELRTLKRHATAPVYFATAWPFVLLDILLLLAILSLILWMIFTQASILNNVLTAHPALNWMVMLAMIKSASRALMTRIIPASSVSKTEGGRL